MANTACDKEQSSEVLGEKKINGKTVTRAGENEEKPNERKNTEQRKYSRQYRSSICNQPDERVLILSLLNQWASLQLT